ncbi:MAG: hypothetical protein RL662_2102 [Bacteroidota bacterium]|jgi:hypothetical protein
MKKYFYILFFSFISCVCLHAQSLSIINELNTAKAGQGKITIYQDDVIKNLILSGLSNKVSDEPVVDNQLNTTATETRAREKAITTASTEKKTIKAKGYRIQVYSGSDQGRSKNEAQYRRSMIQSSFPNMEVNITYNSPVWRVKAGNFRTREQAIQALSDMKSKFSGFGREMYIISDAIKIPVN